MDNENNTKREITEELPDENLTSLAAGGEYMRIDKMFPRSPSTMQGCERFELKPGADGPFSNIKNYDWPCAYCKYGKWVYHDRLCYSFNCCTYPEDYGEHIFLWYTGK